MEKEFLVQVRKVVATQHIAFNCSADFKKIDDYNERLTKFWKQTDLPTSKEVVTRISILHLMSRFLRDGCEAIVYLIKNPIPREDRAKECALTTSILRAALCAISQEDPETIRSVIKLPRTNQKMLGGDASIKKDLELAREYWVAYFYRWVNCIRWDAIREHAPEALRVKIESFSCVSTMDPPGKNSVKKKTPSKSSIASDTTMTDELEKDDDDDDGFPTGRSIRDFMSDNASDSEVPSESDLD